MPKDYYGILGVPRNESPRGIHAVYRDLIKRHHPDRAGPEATRRFQEIVEAYEVLSDPDKRRHYNHSLREAEGAEPAPLRPSRFEAEPLRPEPLRTARMAVPRDFGTVHRSVEELLDRILGNFTGLRVPMPGRIEELNVEVVLSPDEAALGDVILLGVPVFRTCSECGGAGHNWLYPCLRCGGQGIIEDEAVVRVCVPPMVSDRSVLEVPLRGLGIHNCYLRLHIRVFP